LTYKIPTALRYGCAMGLWVGIIHCYRKKRFSPLIIDITLGGLLFTSGVCFSDVKNLALLKLEN
jgi:hypothetical protein